MPGSSTRGWRTASIPSLIAVVLLGFLPFSVHAQLNGTYTIGSGGNYATFTAAVNALTTSGVSGAVTFNVLSGTYTENITIPAITGTDSTKTITFDGGTGNASTRVLTHNATSTYQAVITLNGADYIRFRNLTIRQQNSSMGQGILFTNGADYNEITNCSIALSTSTSTASQVGILASTTTSYTAYGTHGSYNLIKDNSITGGYYGIRWNGSTSSTDYQLSRGNKFINNTLTEWYYYGMYLYRGGAVHVEGNYVFQRTSGVTTPYGYGIYAYYQNDGPVFSYNYARGGYGGLMCGYMNNAVASTLNRAKFYNNMSIGEGISTVYGVATYNAKYADVVYNSARMSTTTGTGYGMYYYGTSGSWGNNFLNNIVSYEGTGTFYPVYVYYANGFNTFDYNLYYRTGTGTNNYYWNLGSSYATLAAMQTAVSGFHQNSVFGDPDWFSQTDLHSTSMAAYQAGTPFTGISDDYDGDTRSSTVPCIGADEYILTNMAYSSATCTQEDTSLVPAGFADQLIIGIEVTVTGSLTPLSITSFSLNTTGSTSASDISAAKIYYTGRSSDFATSTLVGSANNPSGAFTITGNQALQGPGKNYFWLTYDLSAAAPTGNYVDAQCTGITVGGSSYTPTVTNPTGRRMIISPMSGVYTINPLGSGTRNFTSFSDAIDALDVYGAGGAITFNVAAATYNEQLVFTEIPGASSANTITFDGGTGNAASRIISYAVTTTYGSVITLDGADYLRFRNLTVNSTGTYGYCFHFTAQADYNEITDCVLNVPNNTTSSYHIPIVASSTTSYSAYGNWANYNLIKDNEINSGYFGIAWQGVSGSLTSNVGNEFIGNTIQNWYYYGFYMWYSSGTKINHNTIVQRTSGTYTTTGGYGIYHYYPYDGPEFIGNYVYSAYSPMYVVYANQNRSSTSVRGKCLNNMLVATGTSMNYGLYFSYPQYSDIVYNSVFTKTTGTAYGLYNYGSTVAYDIKVANNYIVHQGNGTWYPFYHYRVTDVSQYDYNAYYKIGTGNPSFYWNITTYTSLAALKNATTGYNQNSVWGNPYFISETDLHSRSHVGYQAGTPFAGVTDDFDGDTRSTTAPCIGADEYPAPPPENDLAITELMLADADNKWAHREDPDEHTVIAVLENTGLSGNPASVTVTYKLGSVPANAGDGVQENFSPSWVGQKAVLSFSQKVSGLTPGPLSVHARVFWAQDEDNTNDAASDNVLVETEKVHGIETFDKMDPGVYPLTRDPGFLDLPWTITDNNGGTTLQVLSGMGAGGSQALGMIAPGEAADEWLITPGATLIAGSSYRIGFDFSNLGGSPVTIEAAFGTSPDPSQMSVFATFADIAPGAFMTAKQLAGGMEPYFNTPNLNTTYYLALRFTTSGTPAQFVIDNIKLDDNPSPPPKIAFGLPGADLSTFIDNPDEVILVMANYKQPGMIDRTYEVQSSTNIYGTNGDFLWDVETQTPWITLTKETPAPTAQGYNLIPARPRQFQTFTMTVNPSGLAPGTHYGQITFYGILFNDDFPPPAFGLVATNEPLTITVELRVLDAGSKTGPSYYEASYAMPLTVPGSPYHFVDPQSGHPIATVDVTSGQIDAMTIRAYPNQLPRNITRLLYVERYWQITHSGTGWTADITFPYSDQEAGMVADKAQLRSVRQAVPFGAWEDPTMGTTSVSDPATNQVRVTGFSPANIGGNLALAHPYFMLVKEGAGIPDAFGLEQNYPNPFNPSTTISFSVAEERHVRVAVYNNLGMEVAELVSDMLPAGRYDVRFDATDLPSGTYLYRMTAGDFVQTQRMTLSK